MLLRHPAALLFASCRSQAAEPAGSFEDHHGIGIAKHAGSVEVTTDEFTNWFPHPSPDGKWLVFLPYEKEVKGRPGNKELTLRLMPLAGGKPEVRAELFCDQGAIKVPSWSPDGRKLASVSYQFIP